MRAVRMILFLMGLCPFSSAIGCEIASLIKKTPERGGRFPQVTSL